MINSITFIFNLFIYFWWRLVAGFMSLEVFPFSSNFCKILGSIYVKFFFNGHIILFILFYFWLRWVFVAVHRLSVVTVSRDYASLRWLLIAAASRCRARSLGMRAQ